MKKKLYYVKLLQTFPPSILSHLETLKTEAAEVAKKVEETDIVMAEVNTVSQQYEPLLHPGGLAAGQPRCISFCLDAFFLAAILKVFILRFSSFSATSHILILLVLIPKTLS